MTTSARPTRRPSQQQGPRPDPDAPLVPVIPVTFTKNARTFTFFSAVTTLGTPQELRIECFFPMSAETEENVAALAAG